MGGAMAKAGAMTPMQPSFLMPPPGTPGLQPFAGAGGNMNYIPRTPFEGAGRIPMTPMGQQFVPGTPGANSNVMRMIPSTPAANFIPSTPGAGMAPSTPAASRIPSTPHGNMPPPASTVPMTPRAGGMPQTPAGGGVQPFTPALGGAMPFTPMVGGGAQPFTPMVGGSAQPFTPMVGGAQPFTPKAPGAQPFTPRGPVPFTPAGGGYSVQPFTPRGPPPATPAMGMPMTPGGNVQPFTPRGPAPFTPGVAPFTPGMQPGTPGGMPGTPGFLPVAGGDAAPQTPGMFGFMRQPGTPGMGMPGTPGFVPVAGGNEAPCTPGMVGIRPQPGTPGFMPIATGNAAPVTPCPAALQNAMPASPIRKPEEEGADGGAPGSSSGLNLLSLGGSPDLGSAQGPSPLNPPAPGSAASLQQEAAGSSKEEGTKEVAEETEEKGAVDPEPSQSSTLDIKLPLLADGTDQGDAAGDTDGAFETGGITPMEGQEDTLAQPVGLTDSGGLDGDMTPMPGVSDEMAVQAEGAASVGADAVGGADGGPPSAENAGEMTPMPDAGEVLHDPAVAVGLHPVPPPPSESVEQSAAAAGEGEDAPPAAKRLKVDLEEADGIADEAAREDATQIGAEALPIEGGERSAAASEPNN